MDIELFRKIAELPGISGREEAVRAALLKMLKTCTDEQRVDAMGNIIAVKKGKGVRKLMLAAHMDEIGLLVSHIENNGFLRFVPVGGIDARTLMSQRVVIHTSKGPIFGVIGTKPVHLLDAAEASKAPGIKSLFIDTGLDGSEINSIVSIGDPVTLDRTTVEFGSQMINSKAIDDRAGVYVFIEALKKVKKFDCDIYAVFSVQEEVGLRGAVTSTFGVDPDLALVVDATAANDLPATPPQEFNCRLGQGVAITIMDGGSIINPQIVKTLKKLASDKNIKHQFKVSARGSNDAAAVQKTKSGVPVGLLSIPTRYIHSSIETASKIDIDAAVDLTVAFIENACKYNFDY
ncbi:Peptidase M42 family protein [Elusimicrobium minutum Pei191]|uniref:Peptidase M42 family protein n=1 Tax=Elusimicrobium minutum (strain Pei191) TaxID=445932 RepID=B2KB91_ELUMP|nr:M42 family metallopeptidase [Elusimicrobium minutum]ACC97913.1 Peptidase M42 family protein [Elusimicrobium minutum Pei191]